MNDDTASPIENLPANASLALTGGTFDPGGNVETVANLSMDSTSAATNLIVGTGPSNLTVASLVLTGTENLVSFSTPVTAAGTYEVLTATSLTGTVGTNLRLANFAPSAQVWNYNPATGLVSVTIDPTAGGDITFTNDSENAIWASNGVTDWSDGSNPVAFFDADAVTFGDEAFAQPGTLFVTIGERVQPSSVTFANTTGNDYQFTGNAIAGAGSVTVNGSGVVTFGGANFVTSYVGGTTVNSGCLLLASATALPSSGTGTTVNGGGQLGFVAGGLTDANIALIANNVTWSGGELVFSVPTGVTRTFAGDLTGGAFDASGAAIKVKGGGTLDFTGAILPGTPTSDDGSIITGVVSGEITVASIATSPGSVSGTMATISFTSAGAVDVYTSPDLLTWSLAVTAAPGGLPVVFDNLAGATTFFVLVPTGTPYPAP